MAQKAKLQWLKGDVNSKFFHKAIKTRRNNNGIIGLEVDAIWSEEPLEVNVQYQSSSENSSNANATLDEVDREFLTKEFKEEEIRLTVWDCEGSKILGPDGFNFVFFRHC